MDRRTRANLVQDAFIMGAFACARFYLKVCACDVVVLNFQKLKVSDRSESGRLMWNLDVPFSRFRDGIDALPI